MFTVVIAACVTSLVYMYLLYRQKVHYWQVRNVMSPRRHWLWGSLDGMQRNKSFISIFHNYYREFAANEQPILGLHIVFEPAVFITDPSLGKRMLTKDFAYFRNRGVYHNHEDISGNLFTLGYERWKMFRSKLSPTFTSGKLKGMMPNFLNAANTLLDVIKRDLCKGNHIQPIEDLMQRFTIEIIGSCAFGIQTDSLTNPSGIFSKIIQSTALGEENSAIAKFCMLCFPSVAQTLRLSYMPKYLIDFHTAFVQNILSSKGQRRTDFIDTLVKMKNNGNSKLSLKQITAQSMVFFQAGFETSASALTFALYELAHHEDFQRKVRQEIHTILKQHNNVVTFECLSEMKYLEQIIKETLRLYPITPLIIRQCTSDYKIPDILDEVTIRKGQMIIMPVFSYQRDERFYKQPNTFNPDNFADDHSSRVFLSFGDGPRNCIGMRFAYTQIAIGLIMLLKNFTFECCKQTQNPIVFKESGLLLSPKNEIYLKVSKYKGE